MDNLQQRPPDAAGPASCRDPFGNGLAKPISNLSEEIQQRFRCPRTSQPLIARSGELVAVANPTIRYPIVDGVPILIADEKSLFSVSDFTEKRNTTYELRPSRFSALKKLIPSISANMKADSNYRQLAASLPKGAKILVVGGGVIGQGMEPLYGANSGFEVVGSDVSFGPYTRLVCDAHDIPFQDGTFDCVVVQAVLEHVLNPQRCVDEVWRVLKPAGLVYAETPFMQQVHLRQYDFMRFTHLGHRRLFRNFQEVSSGPACGPGMALAWAYTYFLRSFARSPRVAKLLTLVGYLTAFPLKYLDRFLIDRPGSYDAASGFYFLGKKSDLVLGDSDLVQSFRGL